MHLDDELDNKLSKCNKVLRIKKRWALDDLWLQTFKNKQYLSMRYVFFSCACSTIGGVRVVRADELCSSILEKSLQEKDWW